MQSERNDESRKKASEKKGALIGLFFVVCAVYAVALYAFQPPEYSGATPEPRASAESNKAPGKSSSTKSAPDKPTGQSHSSSSAPGKSSTQASSSSSASKNVTNLKSAKKSSEQSDNGSNQQSKKQPNKQSGRKSSLSAAATIIGLDAKMTGKTLKAIPTRKTLTVFSVDDKQRPPSLAKSEKRDLKRAITELKDAGYDCGFVFLDLVSGRGIARNAGKSFYVASAFKAALISFALQEEGDNLTDYERSNAEAAILYSDNDAYDSFAAAHVGQDYRDWLESYEIKFDSYEPYYATTSAKSMTRIWADLFQFLKTSTNEAKWFADLLSRTNRSFIRSALENTEVIVRNKAGWIAEDDLYATTDCAYIDEKGHPYLMVILTDQPNSDISNRRARQVVKALFDARKALLPQ